MFLNEVVPLHVSHGRTFGPRPEGKHLFASQESVQNSTGKEVFVQLGPGGVLQTLGWVEGLMQHLLKWFHEYIVSDRNRYL